MRRGRGSVGAKRGSQGIELAEAGGVPVGFAFLVRAALCTTAGDSEGAVEARTSAVQHYARLGGDARMQLDEADLGRWSR